MSKKLNVKKRTKEGQCRAMRCKEDEAGQGFCERHEEMLKNGEFVLEEDVPMPLPGRTGVDKVAEAGMKAGLAHADAEITRDAISTEIKSEVEGHTLSIQELVDGLPLFQINNDSDMTFANELLEEIKSKIKSLEARRKTVSKPLNDALKTYNSWFKKPVTVLKNAETLLKSKISEALLATQKAQDEALAAVAASGGEATTEILAVAHGQELVEQPDNISVVETWEVEVQDVEQIPRVWLVPDLQKLKAYAQATEGKIPVAGVRFFKTRNVRQRNTK